MHSEMCTGGQGLNSGSHGMAGLREILRLRRVWDPGSRSISCGSGSPTISCAGSLVVYIGFCASNPTGALRMHPP